MANELRLAIEPKRLPVTPGEPFVVSLHVFNATNIIDGFSATFLGLDAAWVEVKPSPLSLFPDAEGDITAVVTLPRGYPSGVHDIGIKIESLEHPEITAVGVVTLDVASAENALLAVEPQSVTGGKTAYFGVSVTNTGNTDLELVMRGTDAEQVTTVFWNPDTLSVAPGEREDAVATVVGKRKWLGSPVPRVLEFEAVGTGEPLQALATFIQKSRIPRGLLVLAAILLVLGVWLGLVVFGIDKITADEAAAEGGIFTAFDQAAALAADEQAAAAADAAANPAVGTVSGTITAANQSPPQVAGATVTAFDDQGVEVAAAESGDDGTYAIADLPVGTYLIRFTAAGFTEEWFADAELKADAAPLEVTAESGVGSVDAELVGELATLAGTVTTGDDSSGVDVILELVGPATAEGEAAPAAEAPATEASFNGDVNGALLPLATPGPNATTAALPLFQVQPLPLPFTAITNADGEFSIERVPTPATYRLSFVKSGFGTQSQVFTLSAGQSMVDFAVELTDEPASIEGTVSNSAGSPIGDVTVTVAGGDTLLVITTPTTASADAALGSFVIGDLSPGTFSLTFIKEGYVTQVQTVDLVPDEVAFVTVLLDGGPGSISGTTSDSAGLLGGVTVTATDEKGTAVSAVSTTEGSREGTYSIPAQLTPGTYSLRFEKAGYVTAHITVTLGSAENATGIDASLKRGDSITGLVQDRLGPLAGVTVTLQDSDDPPHTRTAVTTADGTFEVVALFELPGPYLISFTKPNYTSIEKLSVPLSKEGTTRVPTQTMLGTPRYISGYVHRPNTVASPPTLANSLVTVSILENGQPTGLTGMSDSSGFFYVLNLPTPGNYTVRFAKSSFQTVDRNVSMLPSANLDIGTVTMGKNGSIAGSVTNRLTQLAGATVTITDFSDDDGSVQVAPTSIPPTTAAANGSYAFSNVPTPGTYTLTVSAPGYKTETASVTLGVGQANAKTNNDTQCDPVDEEESREFPAGVTCLEGLPATFIDLARSNVFGDLLGGMVVTVSFPNDPDGQPSVSKTTGLDGKVTFTGLAAPANFKFTVTNADYQTFSSATIPLNVNSTVSRETLLGYAGSSISGSVTCAGAGSVTGVVVELLKDGSFLKNINANQFGRYFFTNLGPGNYRVRLAASPTTVLPASGDFTPFYPNSIINKDFTGVACP